MATATELPKKDLEFLVDLDKKLNTTRKITLEPGEPYRWCKGYREVTLKRTKYNEKMTEREAEEMLEILKRNSEELIIYPQDYTSIGFAPCFTISIRTYLSVLLLYAEEKLLEFRESQLPKDYNFKTLSEYFMESKNIGLAQSIDISISDDRAKYEY